MLSANTDSHYIERETLVNAVNEFLSSGKKILLIRGASGSGKTALCQFIARSLSSSHFIHYTDLGKISDCSRGFLPNDLPQDNPKALLIFDGYGDNGQFYNLFTTQQLKNWQGKIIITCHSYHLLNLEDPSAYFAPANESKVQTVLLQQVDIPLLTREEAQQISTAFIRTPEEISSFFNQEIIVAVYQNPLLLNMAFQLYEKRTDDIQGNLLKLWYNYHKDKFQPIFKITLQDDAYSHYLKLSYKFAHELQEKQQKKIYYQPQSDLFSDDLHEWQAFFKANNKQLKILQISLPIHYQAKSTLLFWSDSFQLSLAKHHHIPLPSLSLAPLRTAPSPEKLTDNTYLNDKNLMKNDTLLAFLADRVHMNSDFKKQLTRIILASRDNPELASTSANALAILNAAKISFCSRDLSYIRAPGAKLDGGLFAHANFKGADISTATCRDAFLVGTVFDDTQMDNIDFGEYASIDVHQGMIACMALSSDEKYLATYSSSKSDIVGISIWDTNTLSSLKHIYPDYAVVGMFFEQQTNHLIYATIHGEIIVVDIVSGNTVTAYKPGLKSLISVTFKSLSTITPLYFAHQKLIALLGSSPDKKFQICLYDYQYNKNYKIFDLDLADTDDEFGSSLYWESKSSFNGATLAVSQYQSDEVYLIDVKTKRLIKKIIHPDLKKCTALAFSHDNKKLIVGNINHLFFFDAASGDEIYSISSEGRFGPITSLATSALDPWVAINCTNGNTYIWDIGEKTVLNIFRSAEYATKMCVFHQDSTPILCTGGVRGTINFWNVKSSPQLELSRLTQSPAIIYLSERNLIIAGGSDGQLRLWDFNRGICLNTYHAHTLDIQALALSPKQDIFASASADGSLIIWKLNNFSQIHKIQASAHEINCLLFTPDGKTLYSAGYDGKIQRWNCDDGKLLSEQAPIIGDKEHLNGHAITALAFSACGNYILCGNNEGMVISVHHPRNGFHKMIAEAHHKSISCISPAPNGSYLVTGSYDNEIHFYSDFESKPLATLRPHFGEISGLKFTSDSQRLLSGSHDGFLYVWSVANQKILYTIQGEASGILSLFLSADDKHLVITRWSGSIELWYLHHHSASLLRAVGHRLSANNVQFQQAKGLNEKNKRLLKQLSTDEDSLGLNRELVTIEYLTETKEERLHRIFQSSDRLITEQKELRYNFMANWILKYPEVFFCQNYMIFSAPESDSKKDKLVWSQMQDGWGLARKITLLPDSNQYIRTALRHGADVNYEDKTNNSAISSALSQKSMYNFNYLVNHGVSFKGKNLQAAYMAVMVGFVEGLRALQNHGVDFNNSLLLYTAIENGHLAVLEFLDELNVQCDFQLGRKTISSLHLAAQFGYLEIVQYLVLIKKIDVNITDDKMRTPLHLAITYGHTSVAFFLLKQGADPFHTHLKGGNAYMLAVLYSNISLVNYFLTIPHIKIAMKDCILPKGGNLLMIAIIKECEAIANSLIDAGLDVTVNAQGESVILLALSKGFINIIKKILALKPALADTDKKIFALFDQLTKQDPAENIRDNEAVYYLATLIKNKLYQDPDSQQTFLIIVSWLGNLKAVKLLYVSQIINAQSLQGITALMNAAVFGYDDIVEYLLFNQADPNLIEVGDEDNALGLATERGNYGAVKLLCEYKADANHQDKRGFTPLIVAAQRGFTKIGEVLLTKGHADPNLQTYAKKSSALTTSCLHGQYDFVKLLADHKTPFNLKSISQYNALHNAIEGGHCQVVTYLVDTMHMDIEERTADGHTPLMLAGGHDKIDIFDFLYKKKANLNAKDKSNLDVFDAILVRKSTKVAFYLNKITEHTGKLKKAADQKLSLLIGIADNPSFLAIPQATFMVNQCIENYLFLCEIDKENETLPDSMLHLINLLGTVGLETPQKLFDNLEKLYAYQAKDRNHSPTFFKNPNLEEDEKSEKHESDVDDLTEEEQLALAMSMSFEQPNASP